MMFIAALFIFGSGIFAAAFDQRLSHQKVLALNEINSAHHELKEKSEKLAEKEQLLRSITESANDAVILLDSRGLVTYWNTAAEFIFDYKKSEMLGKNLHEILVPEKYLGMHREGFKKFIKTGKGALIDNAANRSLA